MASGLPDQPPPSAPGPTPPPAPEPPAETEDYLDWLENQARGRRAVELDVLLISASVLGTAALILLIVLLVRHVRR